MKKRILIVSLVCCLVSMVQATIVTNTNQSVTYLRLLSRNASTTIDAVYYNPAGLTLLADGLHLALHNQTIFQEKTVVSGFPFLNESTYVGEVDVPVFPSFFAVYKKQNFALSFGFGPNSGGGTADFKKGLPSFEMPISLLPATLSALGLPTSQYSVDLAFKGKSVYYGFQLNASYAVTEAFSVAGGVRYIQAVNKYEGSIKNIMINPFHPLINPGGNMMPAAQFFQIAGMPHLAAQVKDMAVDTKQTGSAFTPILGLHVKPSERLNIGVRYEFNTSLDLENDTARDDTGMFPDGEISANDIPAILALGMEYGLLPEFRITVSYNLFFDKNADWDDREKLVDSNSYDLAVGLEYDLTPAVTVSAGYLYTQVGLSEEYQTDLSHDLSSSAFGLGALFKVHPSFDIEIGGIYVDYQDDKKMLTTQLGPFPETYKRTSWAVAVGLGYHH